MSTKTIQLRREQLELENRHQLDEVNALCNQLFEQGLPIHPPAWVEQGWEPEHFDRCYGYAYALYERGEVAQAKALLGFLNRLNPMDLETTLALGCCALAMGAAPEALAHCFKATQLAPLDPRPYFHMGEALAAISRLSEAWMAYDHASRLAYASPEAFLFKKEAERRAGQLLNLLDAANPGALQPSKE